MQVSDLMTRKVVSVTPDTPVIKVAALLVERHLSAVPVADGEGRVLGIISEGDLMRRPETGTERHSSWLSRAFAAPDTLAEHYTKSHGLAAKDVMTADVVTVGPGTPLAEAADLMERHRVKRLPVTQNERLVGIIARADLIRALATAAPLQAGAHDDTAIRERLEDALEKERHMFAGDVHVTVLEHTAHLWGRVESATQSHAAEVLARGVAGVRSVSNHLAIRSAPVNSPLLLP